MPRIPKLQGISAEKLFPSGALEISVMKDGYRVHKLYMGYPKKVAVRMFKQELKK